MAMGALAVSAASSDFGHLYAQQSKGAAPAKSAPANIPLPLRRFDIAAGPLDEALASYQKTTGVNVLVHLPDGTIHGFRSNGVSGDMAPEVALQRLVADTGLSSKFLDAKTAMIEVAHRDESVTVTAQALQLGLSNYTQPILDTPQTITVVPQLVMQEQQATTLRDALRNVAGISMAAGEGGSQGDNLTIRGFTARNDIFLDGMRDFGSYYRDSFNYEQVEVLQGPSSVTFGRGSTGGIVNQVNKVPVMSPILGGSLNFGTNGLMRLTADVDEPIKALGDGAAFRLNLMGEQTGVAGRDAAEYRRWGVAPSLAFGLGTPTQYTVSYFHEQEDDTPDYGIPWLFNGPAPVPRNNYYGFPNTNFLRTDVDMGTFRIDHYAGGAVSIHNQLRYAHYTRNAQITEAQIPAGVNLSTPLDDIMINRNQISVNSTETMLDDQFDVNWNFRTGPIHHNLVTGVEIARETSDPTRPKWTGVPTTSLLSPDDAQPFAGTFTISSDVHTTAITAGAYVIDTVALGPHWELTGGLRFDRFSVDYNQSVAPAASFSRVDDMPSYRAAVVYKPVARGSIYFDYGTSFNPSAESLSLSAGTADLPPEHNQTFEVGTKWELQHGRTSLRASLFQTTKTNAREPDPDNPLLQVLSGRQLVNGFEAEVSGRLTERWQVMAGYALLNSKLADSVYYPLAVGSRLANVPRNTFNLWSTFDLPWHLQLGAGTNFVDSRTASTTVPIDPVTGLVKEVPAYWVFNAMVKYLVSERVNVQVNVNNLADRYYYDEIHPAHIVPGEARNALVGFNFTF